MFRCGWSVLTSAGRNILRGKIFDENFLMTIATLGAIAIHELPEAVAVMLFFQVGELFQGFAVGRSRRSIKSLFLVKGSTFLDALTDVKTVIFDKTGTLTEGVFQVTQVSPYNGYKEKELLTIAALAESQSNHPVARSIVEAYDGAITESDVTDYEEIPGHGINATVRGMSVLAGNDRLLHRENIEHDTCNVEGTVVHLAIDKKYAGYILIADKIKEDAAIAIARLKKVGVTETVMLTGDNRVVARNVADKLGLDTYKAELLPEDKVEAIEQYLRKSNKKSKVAFVGDGINDAPVIARADVGMAMGAFGSDAAIETADVVLMTDAPSKVAEAIAKLEFCFILD